MQQFRIPNWLRLSNLLKSVAHFLPILGWQVTGHAISFRFDRIFNTTVIHQSPLSIPTMETTVPNPWRLKTPQKYSLVSTCTATYSRNWTRTMSCSCTSSCRLQIFLKPVDGKAVGRTLLEAREDINLISLITDRLLGTEGALVLSSSRGSGAIIFFYKHESRWVGKIGADNRFSIFVNLSAFLYHLQTHAILTPNRIVNFILPCIFCESRWYHGSSRGAGASK